MKTIRETIKKVIESNHYRAFDSACTISSALASAEKFGVITFDEYKAAKGFIDTYDETEGTVNMGEPEDGIDREFFWEEFIG